MYADLHCDTLYECFVRKIPFNNSVLHLNTESVADIRPYIQTFAHYIPEKINSPDEKFCFFQRMLENSYKVLESSDEFIIFKSASDIEKAEAERKILAVLSVEGGDFFYGDKKSDGEKILYLEDNNIKFLSLCYNSGSKLCGGAKSKADKDLDLKALKIAEKLNECGVYLDISHLNIRSSHTLLDNHIKAVATHSNCLAVCRHLRNLDDYCITKLIASDSLIGINMYAPFVKGNNAKISDVVRHIEHICRLNGAENIALGCDFDGCNEFPDGICGPGDIFKLRKYPQVPGDIFYNNVKKFLKKSI